QDLNGDFIESGITGMAAGQQVGYGRTPTGTTHAMMWHGTASSAVDFNPPGAGVSDFFATCGSAQVGRAHFGTTGFGEAAVIWFNSPTDFVDLSTFLPAGQFYNSVATSVTVFNGMYYVGGYASLAAGGGDHAFLWVGVPGPSSGAVLAIFAAG